MLYLLIGGGASGLWAQVSPDYQRLLDQFYQDLASSAAIASDGLLDRLKREALTETDRLQYQLARTSLAHKVGDYHACAVRAELTREKASALLDTATFLKAANLGIYAQCMLGAQDSAVRELARILPVSQAYGAPSIQMDLLRLQANAYRDLGQLDTALAIQDRVYALALSLPDTFSLATVLLDQGGTHMMRGEFRQAMQVGLRADPYLRHLPSPKTQFLYHNLLGSAYSAMEMFAEGVDELEQAVAIAREHGMAGMEMGLGINLGLALAGKGDTTRALAELSHSMEMATTLGEKPTIVLCASAIADIYLAQNRLEEARYQAQKALHFSSGIAPQRQMAILHRRLGEIDLREGRLDAAVKALALSDNLAREADYLQLALEANTLLVSAYEAQHDFESALKAQKAVTGLSAEIESLEEKKYADSLSLALAATRPALKREEEAECAPSSSPTALWAGGLAGLALLGLALWRWRTWRQAQTSEAQGSERAASPSSVLENSEATQVLYLGRAMERLREDRDWSHFMLAFEQAFPGLLGRVAGDCPSLTPTDLRVLALARLGLSADETAELMAISPDSAKKARYRTRKRLRIQTDESLLQYLLALAH